jgi:hypothetical protein
MQQPASTRGPPLICAIAVLLWVLPATAQPLDPHQIYERSCSRCHGAHAREFVNDNLIRSDGEIVGRKTSRDVRIFLEAGHGNLTPQEIETLFVQFESMLATGGLFQKKCRICHDRAARFARLNLVERDGRLVGRYSGRDIAEFLKGHGRLNPDEVDSMIATLIRQLD